MKQKLFGDNVSVIRVPGIKWDLVNVAMENTHRELCKMSEGECHLNGGECTGEWKDYGPWILFDIRKEVKWWNPVTWFLNYYYYFREEYGEEGSEKTVEKDGKTVESDGKTVEDNDKVVDYIRLR
jgi:hypothetical protein